MKSFKQAIKNFSGEAYHWCKTNLYHKPLWTVKLILFPRRYTVHESYFPDKERKSTIVIFFEQLGEIWRNGYVNEFYFPYGFDVKTRKEKKDYLHYRPFSRLRDKHNINGPHSSTFVLRDKLHFSLAAQLLGVKTGENAGIIENGRFFDFSDKKSHPLEYFFETYRGKYFLKDVQGECGIGILPVTVADDSINISMENLRSVMGNSRFIVQKAVEQHPEMAALHPDSLNTIRLVTIRNAHTGEIETFPSMLRIGTGKSKVDNTSQGGLAVGIDFETGKLREFGFYKPEFGTKTDRHPDTGMVFREFAIPYLNEAVRQAHLLHSLFPDIRSVGWDVAISPEEPVFIEGNDNWEINGPQITNGGLKTRFKHLYKP